MDRAALVQEAAERFAKGDDDGFAEFFDPALRVYSEPELGEAPLVSSRTELAALVGDLRGRLPGRSVRLADLEPLDGGVAADLILVSPETGTGGAWRMALAIRFSDQLVSEVRAFWQRDSAIASLRLSK
jgi:hypothetical protein